MPFFLSRLLTFDPAEPCPEVPRDRGDLAQRLSHVRGFAAHLEIGAIADQLGETRAYQGMIIDDEDSFHGQDPLSFRP